ncbi:MAG: hypothetical protein ACXABY_01820 [Candidatus Thorarchaeota archaeon]|jgi:hypothetical protein
MPPKVNKPFPGIIHLEFNSQRKLAQAFMRIQEFYESPLGDFRGRFFTSDEFKQAYAEFKGGEFTYYTDWNGFNVPGDVADKFIKMFEADLEPWTHEQQLVDAIKEHREPNGRYYVIGTHTQGVSTVGDHELSHAFWHLDLTYRESAQHLVEIELPVSFRALAGKALQKLGYHEDVLDDEITAYLSTSTLADMAKTFDTEMIPWNIALKFQQHFENYLEARHDEQE